MPQSPRLLLRSSKKVNYAWLKHRFSSKWPPHNIPSIADTQTRSKHRGGESVKHKWIKHEPVTILAPRSETTLTAIGYYIKYLFLVLGHLFQCLFFLVSCEMVNIVWSVCAGQADQQECESMRSTEAVSKIIIVSILMHVFAFSSV